MGTDADKKQKQKKMKGGVKKQRPEGSNSHGKAGIGGSDMVSDSRFASAHTDPRFQRVSKKTTKVTIDSRFSRMFTDKDFDGSSAPVDKRGRRKKQDSSSALHHHYLMEEGEGKKNGKVEQKDKDTESEDEEAIEKEQLRKPAPVAESESSSEAESSDSDDDRQEEDEDDTTTDEEGAELVCEDDVPEVEVENIPVIEDGTRRLAAVNMDWRHVRAVDLLVVLRSFLQGGSISSVAVYPSEFGLQRMKEEVHGPVGLFDDKGKNEDDSSDSDDEIDEEKLRSYEKSRLRYYFAVVECDSVATAEHLYSECDGVEFERSSNVLDLRFIPDSMEFKHPPRDIATKEPGSYDGIDFHTKALQHSNIPISWDEDEPQRVKTLNRKFNDDQLADMELQEFLASDEGESDDSENDDDSKKDKYHALIKSGDGSDGEEEDDEAQEMEITFNTDLENLSKRLLEKKDKKSETVWEEFLRKRKEKKAARKQKSKSKYSSSDDESDSDVDDVDVQNADDFFVEDPPADKGGKKGIGKKGKSETQKEEEKQSEATTAELELLLADDQRADDAPKGYNMKPKKAKGKRGKEAPDESKIPTVDYEDPRFSDLFNHPLFALDPTDPQFKRSAAYARQMAQKQHKGDREQSHKQHQTEVQPEPAAPETTDEQQPISDDQPQQNTKHELSSLVKSIKMKSKQLEQSSNSKASIKKRKNKSKHSSIAETGDLSTLVESAKKKAKAR